MRAHTASGTGPELPFAPEPTAFWLTGKRVRGSAPALGTGGSVPATSGMTLERDGVLVAGVLAVGFVVGCAVGCVAGFGVGRDPEATDLLTGDAGGVEVRSRASVAVGGPAPQAVRARQISAPATVLALAVVLRGKVRSVRQSRRSGSATVTTSGCR